MINGPSSENIRFQSCAQPVQKILWQAPSLDPPELPFQESKFHIVDLVKTIFIGTNQTSLFSQPLVQRNGTQNSYKELACYICDRTTYRNFQGTQAMEFAIAIYLSLRLNPLILETMLRGNTRKEARVFEAYLERLRGLVYCRNRQLKDSTCLKKKVIILRKLVSVCLRKLKEKEQGPQSSGMVATEFLEPRPPGSLGETPKLEQSPRKTLGYRLANQELPVLPLK